MNEFTFDIVRVVIAVTMVLITTYLVPLLKKLSESERYKGLVDFVKTAVTAAEQTIRGTGMGEKKYAEVEKAVKDWLNGKGIAITQEQLTALIEAAVYEMNKVKAG